jgi:hypothetical protein
MTHLLQPGGEAHDMRLHLLQAGLHSALETCKSPAVTTAHDSGLRLSPGPQQCARRHNTCQPGPYSAAAGGEAIAFRATRAATAVFTA